MQVPFIDLDAQYDSIKDEIKEALDNVLNSTSFVLGRQVAMFEEEFAEYCRTKYCVALNSGTSALHLALIVSGISQEDEVITVPNTFIATVEAISYTGAIPVFVDINPETYNIDVTGIEDSITKKTKAIIPVHLCGQPVDMDPISKIARKHNLIVIEDACQAHGAEYKGKRVGGIGQIGCFSFYPSKNLGAYGEGGAIVTNDKSIYNKIRMLRVHGESRKYFHEYIGYNYRMSGFQGAVLGVKLKYLDQWIEARRKNASIYNELLKDVDADIVTPTESNFAKSVYYLYVIRIQNRDDLQKYLAENGVATGLHYPIPIHLQKAYQFMGHKKGDFPFTEQICNETLSLPIFAELTSKNITIIVNSIDSYFKNCGG